MVSKQNTQTHAQKENEPEKVLQIPISSSLNTPPTNNNRSIFERNVLNVLTPRPEIINHNIDLSHQLNLIESKQTTHKKRNELKNPNVYIIY